jgi:glycosyltransferase involved in cell wall biosynthesis
MIAHLTSKHNSDDARIYRRTVCTLRKDLKVYYYCRDDKRIDDNSLNIKFEINPGRLNEYLLTFRMFWFASRNRHVSIIHFHDPEFLLFTWLPRLFGKTLVYDIHENFHVKFQFGSWLNRRVGGVFFRMLEWISFKFIQGLVTVSESLGDKYSSHPLYRVTVRNVPLKSSLTFTESDDFCNPFRIYVSGNHSEQRSCSNIVRAIPRIIREIPEAHLLLVGRYTPKGYQEYLLSLANELCVSDKIFLEPMKDYSENLLLATQSGVGLILYEDNVNNRVGLPNRLFEYMAAGIPVVVENFAELRSVVNKYECGVCVDSADPEMIARAILRILNDREQAKNMGSNGRIAVQETINFEEESKQLVKLYNFLW